MGRLAIAAMLLSLLSFPVSLAIAQCTDSDLDGYYYEDGCGTLRDCNDANPGMHPEATEICNGYDDDCDGSFDEACDTACDYPQQSGSDIRITFDQSTSWQSCHIWTGSGYGVAWIDQRDGVPGSVSETYFARLDSSGNKIGSDVRVSYGGGTGQDPSLVWTGKEYGVSWDHYRSDTGNYEIYFARLDSSGNKIGTDTRVTYRSSHDYSPSLVWTGHEYGIAWVSDEIYFARLDPSGNKISSDVRITYNIFGSGAPSLVWSGNGFGLSWVDLRDGNQEIYFARLDPSGNKIGSDVRITYNSSVSQYPSTVWTGNSYGLSWVDYRDGLMEVYFAGIDSSGNKIGSDIRVTNGAWIDEDAVPLAWTGTEFGAAYRSTSHQMFFVRMDSSGNKIGSEIRITYDLKASSSLSLMWTGSKYAFGWSTGEIYLTLIGCCNPAIDADSDGYNECVDCNDHDNTVHPDAPELCDGIDHDCDGTANDKDADNDGYIDQACPGGTDCNDGDPNINPGMGETLCNGADENCNLADDAPDRDSDGYDVCGAKDIVNPDKLPRDCNDANPNMNPGAVEVCNGFDDDCDGNVDNGCSVGCSSPGVCSDVRITYNDSTSGDVTSVWTGSGYGICWVDARDGNYEIYFARLDSSGAKIGSDVRVTNDASDSYGPSLVWTGSGYGVSWDDYRDGNYEIYFTRLDFSGAKIGSDVRVTNDASGSHEPSLVWTGSGYGVSWDDYRDGNYEIYFTRLDFSGAKIGSEVRVTNDASGSYEPSLVWTGSEYGISWNDNRDGNDEIYFASLSSSGAAIVSDTRVTEDPSVSYAPSLAWTGSEYAISWEDDRDTNSEIYFARLRSSGHKIGSDVRVTNDASGSFEPSLVWTGSEYGVSWYDDRDGNNEAYFAKLDSSGVKIGSDVRVTKDASDSYVSSLVWTGSEYGVPWDDNRPGNYEIYFVRITCAVVDQDSDGFIECNDCNDNDNTLYPGAPQLCDGKNNDCKDPNWPSVPANETDYDGDKYVACAPWVGSNPAVVGGGDCNDNDASVYPGAAELCDDKDNDCDATVDEGLSIDADGDGHYAPGSCLAPHDDCNDNDNSIYPGAAEICDGKNNDCSDPSWPQLKDADSDGTEDSCETDDDNDGTPDTSDPYPCDPQNDADGDGIPCNLSSTCGESDNCCNEYNPGQSDIDGDGEGDVCDLNDGLIFIFFNEPNHVEWQQEIGFETWNCYKGDLDVLKATGIYTQLPGSNPLARQDCGLLNPWTEDFDPPAVGKCAYFMATGESGGVEGSLGKDSAGNERPNDNPCP